MTPANDQLGGHWTVTTVWDESHFEAMSWHDNHVHGPCIREGDYGCGELELDPDCLPKYLIGATPLDSP